MQRGWRSIAGVTTVCALGALATLATAGTAAAETSLQVTINGKPMTSSGPQISATLFYRGTDQWLLTVTNASSNDDGADITEVDGAVAQAARQKGIVVDKVAAQADDPNDTFVESPGNGISLTFTAAPVNACFEPQMPQTSFACPTMYASFGPGRTVEYVVTANDMDANLLPLTAIDVRMRLGSCPGEGHERRLASATDACALPGVTTIAKASVDRKAGKASFAYKAGHAKTYVCELISRSRVLHRTSCGAAKAYRSLSAGTYFFLVWGVNQAGIAKKATVYGFKVG